MTTLYIEVTLALSADELWAKVNEVGGTCGLLPDLTECSATGDTRACSLADGTRFVENILGVDEVHRRVGYSGYMQGGFALPSEFHTASMEVIDEGGGSATLRWITDIKPDEALEGLKALVETVVEELRAAYPMSAKAS